MKASFILLILIMSLRCATSQNNASTRMLESVPKIPMIADEEAKAAGINVFYLPIKLEGIDKEFRMQVDLGLDVSAIYGNSLKAILAKYPNLQNKVIEQTDYKIFRNNYSLHKHVSALDSLFVFDDYGSDAAFEEQDIIGSIGVNQFDNQILLINYKEGNLQIFENETLLERDKFEFIPMRVTSNKKIILTLNVGGTNAEFLFDTGNGVPLATINKDFFMLQTEQQKELRDTITGNSWGEVISLYGAKQQKTIAIKNTPLPVGEHRIYFTPAKRIVEMYKELGVEHSIGNNFFMEKTIVFDFKNKQFGILKSN